MDTTKILSILIAAKNGAGAAFAEAEGQLKSLGVASKTASGGLGQVGVDSEAAGNKLKTTAAVGVAAVAAGLDFIGVKSIEAAGNFQAQMTRLVTSAGETQANLKLVSDGVLSVATSTGTSATMLANAMYTIESAGYHGADGLNVLKAAAQGAKAENADVATVADAVSSTLIDYHLKASDAAMVTSKLITAVAQGKTTFQDLASSMHSVLPIASAAGISLDNITAAEASMTVHGMSADQASQDLAHSIEKMMTPTQSMTNYLAQLGINSADLQTKLGKEGLTGVLQDISTAIEQKMGPDGKIVVDAFNQSKTAAADLQTMLKNLPPNLQGIAKAFSAGTLSVGDLRKEMKNLPADQAALMTQYESLSNSANGFNNMLKSGQPAAKAYAAALQAATGDSTTLNTALMLTGENADYTNNAVKNVAAATTEASGNVKGWADIQGNFNQQMDVFKASVQTTGIALGSALLPAATALLKVLDAILIPLAEFVEKHRTLSGVIFGVVASLTTFTALVLGAAAAWGKLKAAMAIVGLAKEVKDAEGVAKSVGLIPKAMSGISVAFNGIKAAIAGMAGMEVTAFAPLLLTVGLVVLAVAAIGLVAYEVITHWKQVSKFFEDLWKDITKIFDAGIKWIKDHWLELVGFLLGGPVGLAVVEIIKHWGNIKKGFDDAMKGIMGGAKKVGGDLVDVWNGIAPKVAKFFEAIPGEIMKALAALPGLMLKLLDSLAYLWGFEIRIIWNLVTKWIPDIVRAIMGELIKLPGQIANIWNTVVSATGKFLMAMWTAVSTWFVKMGKDAVALTVSLYNGVVNWFVLLPGRTVALVTQVWTGVSIWFTKMWHDTVNIVGQMINAIINFFAQLPGRISSFVGQMLNAGHSVGNGLVNGFMGIINGLPSLVSGIFNKVVNAIKSWAGSVASATKNVAGSMWNSFKAGLGIHSPSYIEKALVAIETQSASTLKQMKSDVSSFGSVAASVGGVNPALKGLAAGGGGTVTNNTGGSTVYNIAAVNLTTPEATAAFFKQYGRNLELTSKGLTPVGY